MFSISEILEYDFDRMDLKDRRYILSHITRVNWDGADNAVDLKKENVESLLETVTPPQTLTEAIDRVLVYLSKKQTTFAQRVEYNPNDFPLVIARDEQEFRSLFTDAREMGFLVSEGEGFGRDRPEFRLAVPGWDRARDFDSIAALSDQAFVAMWFDEQLDSAWIEGFQPALRDCGFKPVRSGSPAHNDNIIVRILADIRRSGLFVADFTGHRGGVYFEAGFAMGLKIPVVRTCRSDHWDDLHFDVEQYTTLRWEDPSDLRIKLTDQIVGTQLALAVPPPLAQ